MQEKVREYIARTGVQRVSREEFAATYVASPPLLLSVRGQRGDDTARVMTLVLSPDEKRKLDPLSRYIYSLEKSSDRNSFAMWVTLGRASNNDIVVQNSAVSKFHATFERKAQGYVLCDRRSTYGTAFLRGDERSPLEAHKEVALEDRCMIEFGGDTGELLMYLATPGSVYDVLSGLK